MRKIICSTWIFLYPLVSLANNIGVSNVALTGKNTTSHYIMVSFSLAWENSWRTSNNESNWDGAWVFIKFRKNASTDWQHATINLTGFTPAAGCTVSPSADGKGAFFYRASDGIGNVNFIGNALRWNYGSDGVLDNETVEVKVFAIEVVYIPQGPFYLGSGGTETYRYSEGSTNNPFLVSSNNTIVRGTSAGNLNSNNGFEEPGNIPDAYPKGFNAFWIMKYEVSQQQYCDFLNLLSLTQATVHIPPSANPLSGTHPNITAPRPEIAMTAMNWTDLAALCDWSGLRPMTELEFEKACRGSGIGAVADEYSWGNTSATLLSSVSNQGTASETVTTPANANACCDASYQNATRTGIFARPISDRILSGAGYFGVMNLSDNVSETCISTANAAGRSFDGSIHGDGSIASDGQTDITNWKLTSTVGPGDGYGLRGGNFFNVLTWGRVSDRTNSSWFWGSNDDRSEVIGLRMARTAE